MRRRLGVENFELNIGRACNSRCVFCVSRKATPAERAWVSLDHARTELEQARRQGCTALGFLGGEPTAHPRLLELVQAGRQLGFTRIALGTNGLRLADPDFLLALLDAGVTRVGVSIHADIASIEDRLTRVKGGFARKRQALKNLVAVRDRGRLKDGLAVNPVLHRRLLDRLPRMLAFLKRLGIDDVRFNSYRPVTLGREDRALCPRLPDVTPRLQDLIAANESRFHFHLTLGDFPFCAFPAPLLDDHALLARYVGERFDLDTRVSIVSEKRSAHGTGLARFSWRDAKRDRLKAKPCACRACAWEPACEGIWLTCLELWGESEARPLAVRPPAGFSGARETVR